jgi:hypothetical protein
MSKNITIDNCLLSIASNNMSVTAMLSVSVECFFRLPFNAVLPSPAYPVIANST